MALPDVMISSRTKIHIDISPTTEMPFGISESAQRNILADFRIQRQLREQWCWAAVAASIASFHDGINIRQCNLAERFLGEPCCMNMTLRACDVPWLLDEALRFNNNLEDFFEGRITLNNIKFHIDNKCPVCCRIEWPRGNRDGHFIVIYGYSLIQDTIAVADPLRGVFPAVSFPAFLNSYENGQWTTTYITKKRFS